MLSKAGYAQLQENEASYYAAISSSSIKKVNDQLELLKNSSATENEAYVGALLMKKAGLVLPPAEKLKLFKLGRSELELMIQKEEGNVEYRFLRVIIQENAPKFLKYYNELDEDCRMIKNSFKKLSPSLQEIILDYSKKSTRLKLT